MIPGICDVIGETGQEQVAKAAAEQAVDEIPVLLKIGEAVEQILIITVMAVSVGERLNAYSARTAHPFQRNGAPFRFKLSKAQQVD